MIEGIAGERQTIRVTTLEGAAIKGQLPQQLPQQLPIVLASDVIDIPRKTLRNWIGSGHQVGIAKLSTRGSATFCPSFGPLTLTRGKIQQQLPEQLPQHLPQ